MTDEEAIKTLAQLAESCGMSWARPALRHALVALSDRASLVEASWSTGLPDGILLRIDAARRHMEGK